MRCTMIGPAARACAAARSQRQTTLAVPNRVNSTPWVAAAGSFVAVAWGAAAKARATSSSPSAAIGGRTFRAPVRVNAVEGDARISGEIAPRVALLSAPAQADPLITVTWNAKDGTTQIKTARSRDGGRTFVEEKNLQTTGAAGDRGWQASTLDAQGHAARDLARSSRMAADKAAGDHAEHKGEHDGVAMAQKSALYYAADGQPERELFKGVCYCCKTALALRTATARSTRRGVMSSPATCATWASPCRATAARPSRR